MIMTVKELIEVLSNCKSDDLVVVSTSLISYDPNKTYMCSPHEKVTWVGSGIDWDSGKCFIFTEHPVFKND